MHTAYQDGDGLPGTRLVRGVMLALGLGSVVGLILLFWTPVLPHERERTSAAPPATPAARATARASPPTTEAPVAQPPPAGATTGPVPAPAAAPPTAQSTTAAARRHTIRAGDTLLGIAEQYDTTVDAIRAANPGLTETALQVGVEITIPPGR